MYSYDNAPESLPSPYLLNGEERRHRSATAPVGATRPHPNILKPGYARPTIHKPTLFFTEMHETAEPQTTTAASVPVQPQWPYDSYFGSHPQSAPATVEMPRAELPYPPYPQAMLSSSPDTPTMVRAPALSRSPSTSQQVFLETLTNQEEEDLARALEESMRMNSYSSAGMLSYNAVPGPSKPPAVSHSPTQLSDDEALARKLAAEDEPAVFSPSLISQDEEFARQLAAQELEEGSLPHSPDHKYLTEDEALARKIAAEEELEKRRAEELEKRKTKDTPPIPIIDKSPPAYLDSVTPSTSSSTQPSPSIPSTNSSLSADPNLYRSNSAKSYESSSLTSSARSTTSEIPPDSSLESTVTSINTGELSEDQMAVGGNHFIDLELLRGVSIGFSPPAITPTLKQMEIVMPNIISLPYGKCPPLHFMAPTWRHMLKLMARLSGTRMEPTVEALAANKHDLFLRTVIQFVRPHHASLDWRTVIWFTIDHPVPPSIPNARKYTIGDVDMLPWSYTLSTPPNLLRDSAETPISKTYTIPYSDTLPYPKLPISFPNLALYLQAALDVSRRFASDSSSGNRKLSKMMDICYPSLERSDSGEQNERSGMGGLIRKAFGRGKNANKQGRGGNMDTYELVTPFVPDEWG